VFVIDLASRRVQIVPGVGAKFKPDQL